MRKYLIIGIALFSVNVYSQKLDKRWEVKGLEVPESVVYYKDAYYVSNVAGQPAEKNGAGYIAKVGLDGEIIQQKWASGFNAPKGLGVFGNKLYISDIDVVHEVNLESGDIIKSFEAEGATFLNDIEVAKNGAVYITDTFGGNAIYKIEHDEIDILVKDEKLDYPNGLILKGNNLYVASWGVVTNSKTFETEVPGKILRVSLKDLSIEELTKPTGNLDGLVTYKSGFIASDWIAGKLLNVSKKGVAAELLDLNSGTADIYYAGKTKLLLVPQMMDGKLVAYELN